MSKKKHKKSLSVKLCAVQNLKKTEKNKKEKKSKSRVKKQTEKKISQKKFTERFDSKNK